MFVYLESKIQCVFVQIGVTLLGSLLGSVFMYNILQLFTIRISSTRLVFLLFEISLLEFLMIFKENFSFYPLAKMTNICQFQLLFFVKPDSKQSILPPLSECCNVLL